MYDFGIKDQKDQNRKTIKKNRHHQKIFEMDVQKFLGDVPLIFNESITFLSGN